MPQNMKKILPEYSFQMVTSEQDEFQYPEFSWGVSNCISWKEDWDVTIGGLFPYMTTETFFNYVVELSDPACEEILSFGFDI